MNVVHSDSGVLHDDDDLSFDPTTSPSTAASVRITLLALENQ